tara:strand:+ start:463 stop:759 length:297 start_codon:yes stop_codon:yes gene_type:complete
MNYDLVISEEARLDIIDAFSWYELQREGLGFDFELCLEAGIEEIIRNPLAFELKYRSLRAFYIARFPYGIHYVVEGKIIFVLAVLHTSRSPSNWEDRL